jgi:4-amino-4-deoxy-L-arabinose transferase-like glycosyltransferase
MHFNWMSRNVERMVLPVLVLLWWVVFWNLSEEFRPGMDAMTYNALAKHILTTGDWKVLHYSSNAYANFYQHPPLAIWIQALFFKVFGATDITSKIFPNLAALGTIVVVYHWGKKIASHWVGFLGGIMLIASIRYTKYAIGLMLDVPMTFFLVLGAFLWLRSTVITSFLSGICFAAAFLCKGPPAAILPAAVMLMALVQPKKQALSFLSFVVGAAIIFLMWFSWGQGFQYLTTYWKTSVAGRIGGGTFTQHLAPVVNLVQVYWYGLPFFLLGLFRLIKSRSLDVWMAALLACGTIAGFCYSGNFLEQYLVPFYPFAAILVAIELNRLFEKLQIFFAWNRLKEITVSVMVLGIFVYSLIMMAVPIHVQGNDHQNPYRELLKLAAKQCRAPDVKLILIPNWVSEDWWAYASGLWYTPWDVKSVGDQDLMDKDSKLVNDSTILLVGLTFPDYQKKLESLHWVRTSLIRDAYAIYQRVELGKTIVCPE